MIDAERKLWPFDSRTSLIATAAIFVAVFLLVGVLRIVAGWPSAQSEGTVLVGILVLALLPIALRLLDVVIDRGAVIEYGGLKLAFAQSRDMGTSGLTIAANIGVREKAITHSGTKEILDSLKQSSAHEVVVIDLEEGQAWWETRLLVLLAGAKRRGRPERIVFVGTDANTAQQFQGWACPSDLFPRLIKALPQFEEALLASQAVVQVLALADLKSAGVTDWQPPLGPLAKDYEWMVRRDGLPNELIAEQVLQSELGARVEEQGGSRSITLVRLAELFGPVLNKGCIDLKWSAERQLDTFLDNQAPFLAITQDGRYLTLVPRLTLLNQLLKPVLKGSQKQ
jgi:hypothetical protein